MNNVKNKIQYGSEKTFNHHGSCYVTIDVI